MGGEEPIEEDPTIEAPYTETGHEVRVQVATSNQLTDGSEGESEEGTPGTHQNTRVEYPANQGQTVGKTTFMDGIQEDNAKGVPVTLGDPMNVQQRGHLQALLDLRSKNDSFSGNRIGVAESELCHELSSLFSSPAKLVSTFSQKHDDKDQGVPNVAGIDFRAVRGLYDRVKSMDIPSLSGAVLSASAKLLEENKLAKEIKSTGDLIGPGAKQLLSSWLIIFANPLLQEPENQPLLQSLAKAFTLLGDRERAWVVSTLASLSTEDLKELVDTVQQCITVQLYETDRVTEGVQLCTKLLKILFDANLKSRRLPIASFNNDAVNDTRLVKPEEEYQHWRRPQRYAFSFCNYPFILDPATKSGILRYDSALERQEHFHRAFLNGIFGGFDEPFNVMRVRREHLIHDAITHVQRKKDELKKPLKVQFIGEDGVDEGGVRKEFFQLVVQELFDPKYGMFSYREETRQFWFSLQTGELKQIQEEQDQEFLVEQERKQEEEEESRAGKKQAVEVSQSSDGGKADSSTHGASKTSSEGADEKSREEQTSGRIANSNSPGSSRLASAEGAEDLELRREYELVGMLLGLAIYNQCILDVRFPRVLYKKLLGRPLGLEDLEGLDHDLAKGLKNLLEFEGDVEEVFDLSFQITVEDIFGDKHVIDLKPGGGDIPLTSENRRQYVDLCVKFYLDTSIRRQYEAFAKGFKHLVPDRLLKLFEPEELELLICGSSALDFEDLEKGAHYTDGYSENHQTVRDFWEIAHDLSETDKKNLLMFVTGCDRAPIQGLGSLKFTISRNGPDSDRLPSAHTCFNHLLLPQYKTKDKLKDRLLTAINNAKGFGLR